MADDVDTDVAVTPVSVEESWMKQYWRPCMAYLYMMICFFDFIGFPLASMLLPHFITGVTYAAWKPITLEGGGMIHMAFGAILGIAAWTRGAYEKKA